MVYGADIVLIFSITKTREMLDHIFHIVTFENIIQHMAENPPPVGVSAVWSGPVGCFAGPVKNAMVAFLNHAGGKAGKESA
jgi:hypothetical protein